MKTVFLEEGWPLATLSTLLALVKNSIGSNQYLSLYVDMTQNGAVKHFDVIENGRFACAYYASSVLTLMNLLEGGVHTTVAETEKDLTESGWYNIATPIPGSVIVWADKVASDGKPHLHIGFYLEEDMVVSTDGNTGLPTKHHVTYGTKEDGSPVREIKAIYFHDKLRPFGN